MSRDAAEVVDLPEDVGFPRVGYDSLRAKERALTTIRPDAPGLTPALGGLVRLLTAGRRRADQWMRLLAVLGSGGALAGLAIDMLSFDLIPTMGWIFGGGILGAMASVALVGLWSFIDSRSGKKELSLPLDAFEPGQGNEIRRALAATPFVLWHDGRYIQNLRLPLGIVGVWHSRVDAALEQAAERLAELQAGDALLGELASTGRSGKAADALDEVRSQREAAEIRLRRLEKLKRGLAASQNSLESELHRRRRPPARAETSVEWHQAIDGLVAEAVEVCGEG